MAETLESLKKKNEYLYKLLNENTVYHMVPPGTKITDLKLHNRRVGLGKTDENTFYVRFKNLIPKSRKIQTIQFAVSREALISLFQLLAYLDKK